MHLSMVSLSLCSWLVLLVALVLCGGATSSGKLEFEDGDGHQTSGGTIDCKQKSALPGYSCQGSLRSEVYDLHWALTSTHMAYALDVKTAGWVAIGWSRTLQMYGADAVIGHTAVGGGSVATYLLSYGDRVENVLGPTTKFKISNTSAEWSNGRTIIRFTRPLSGGNHPILQGTVNPMIASWSADGSTTLAYHVNNFATFLLDLRDTPVLEAMPEETAAVATNPVASPGCTRSNMVGYRCSLMAGEGVSVHWRLEATKVALAIEAHTTGWLGLGWSAGGSMIGAEVVLWKGSGIPGTFKISGLSAAQIIPRTTFRIMNQAVNTTSKTTVLRFERELDDVGTVPWSVSEPTSMIWAHSGDGTTTFQNHGNSNRASFMISYKWNSSTALGNSTLQGSAGTPTMDSLPSACVPSTLSGYRCMVVVRENAFVVHWKTSVEGVSIAINHSSSSWVSLGWSKEGKMKDTDAVVASDQGRGMQVSTYALTGTGSSSVQPTSAFQITESSVNTTGTHSLTRFTRMFGDNGIAPAKRTGNNILVWAMSTGSSSALDYHGGSRGTIVLNFESGDSTLSGSGTKPQSLYSAHAWLMWIAFGMLFPAGIFFARFGQTHSFTPQWFYAHVGIQTTACVLAAVAMLIALTSFEDDSWHGTMGKIVAGLMLAQALLGVFRVQKTSPRRPLWYYAHWALGIIAVLLGFLTVFWGIDRYNERYSINADNWRAAFGVNVGSLVVAYIILSLVFTIHPNTKSQHPVQMVRMVSGNGHSTHNAQHGHNGHTSARSSVDSMAPLHPLDIT